MVASSKSVHELATTLNGKYVGTRAEALLLKSHWVRCVSGVVACNVVGILISDG
jgi:hypothetical protein